MGTPPALSVTMEAVAEEAGVSRATVSRVFYGTTPVSQGARDAVYAAAERLGYVPNVAARRLAAHGSDLVGVLLRGPSNPAYGLLFSELQENVSRLGLQMIAVAPSRYEGANYERQALHRLLGLRVGGLIVSTGVIRAEMLEPFLDAVPVVVVGRQEANPRIYNVCYDEDDNATRLADAVADQGHAGVAVVISDGHNSSTENRRGRTMAARLRSRGVTVHEIPAPLFGVIDQGAGEVIALRRSGAVTAVMYPSDLHVLAFLPHLQAAGLRTPEDLSVTGCDGVLPGIDLMGIATMRIPVEEAARRGAEVMHAMLTASQPVEIRHESLPGELLPGRTLGPPPRL